MTLGNAIRRLRAAGGWSQKDFARRLEISPSYLSLIETDRREPALPLVRRIADALGLPATILFAAALGGGAARGTIGEEYDIALDRLVEVAGLNLVQAQLDFGGGN
jgi:transcriptional regulator with XRE-family HTH domain